MYVSAIFFYQYVIFLDIIMFKNMRCDCLLLSLDLKDLPEGTVI